MSLMYLEDYLELISYLPQEFRIRLGKVRDLDVEVSNHRDNIEKLKDRLRNTVTENSTDSLIAERQSISNEINAECDKVVQLGVEKVNLVHGLEEMMVRYNRRLAADTEKFKLELEADNPGITEALEARAEAEIRSHRESLSGKVSASSSLPTVRRTVDMTIPLSSDRRSAILNPMRPPTSTPGTPKPQDLSQSQRRSGAAQVAGGMLARAANQAIQQTQQMPQGRRTASMKANYEATLKGASGIDSAAPGRKRVSRKKADADADSEDAAAGDEDKEVYCFCKQPSFGFMIACDAPGCPIEWFHGSCVGVNDNAEIEKKWFCLPCQEKLKQKKQMKQTKLTDGEQKLDSASKVSKKQQRKGGH